MNLGIVQTSLGKYLDAEKAYQSALRHKRGAYADCHYNLGNLYLAQGRKSQAMTSWRNATEHRPTHLKAWINQIVLLDEQVGERLKWLGTFGLGNFLKINSYYAFFHLMALV